jgi:hypothetical protein
VGAVFLKETKDVSIWSEVAPEQAAENR